MHCHIIFALLLQIDYDGIDEGLESMIVTLVAYETAGENLNNCT